jgi:hypothetical protein
VGSTVLAPAVLAALGAGDGLGIESSSPEMSIAARLFAPAAPGEAAAVVDGAAAAMGPAAAAAVGGTAAIARTP